MNTHLVTTVAAYYEHLGLDCQGRLTEYWQDIWRKHGWNPIILTLSDAQQHPLYEQVKEHAATLPTVNDRSYETACYVRWCAFAMAATNSPIAVTDYDVFPCVPSFPPCDPPAIPWNGDLSGGPGWIFGRRKDFEHIIELILSTSFGVATPLGVHMSDMHILTLNSTIFPRGDISRAYTIQGWESSPLVHFANGYISNPADRKNEIQRILASRNAPH